MPNFSLLCLSNALESWNIFRLGLGFDYEAIDRYCGLRRLDRARLLLMGQLCLNRRSRVECPLYQAEYSNRYIMLGEATVAIVE